MAEVKETKDSSTQAAGSSVAGAPAGSKSEPADDDADRLGGDIKTRSAGQPGGAAGSQEDDDDSGETDDDDAERGA